MTQPVPSYRLSSENRRLNFELMKLQPCPIHKNISRIKMTREDYIKMCKKHSNPGRGSHIGVQGIRKCDWCEEKAKIQGGGRFRAPKGITFYSKAEYKRITKRLMKGRKPFVRPVVNDRGYAV